MADIPNLKDCTPKSLHSGDFWLNWAFIDGRKAPVDNTGQLVAHFDHRALTSIDKAIERHKANPKLGAGISLGKDGLQVGTQWVWCLDFDGFLRRLKDGSLDFDNGVVEFLERLGTWVEISPSETGAKAFFISDKKPTPIKLIAKFGPSKFINQLPDVRKYQHREVEVFSKGFFLTVTGERLGHWKDMRVLSEAETDEQLVPLNDWAISTGGEGFVKKIKTEAERSGNAGMNSAQVKKEYAKPLLDDMATVLLYVDAEDEQIYSDVANGLARTYGESGRKLFLDYCTRSTNADHQSDLASGVVDQRYSRALRELGDHPKGLTAWSIIQRAKTHPDYPQDFEVRYEGEVNFIPAGLFCDTNTKPDSPSNHGDLDTLFSDIELRQEDVDAMDEAEIIFPEMIVKGHVQAYVSPANGGKTTIMTYACEKLAADDFDVFYINVDGSPGDLKRHHAHAKRHGYKVLAPDARKGGSIQSVHSKLQKLAIGTAALGNTILIFDTLKKFVQVIEKAKAAAFFKLTRALSVKGATVILLGHTNKHAGEDGLPVFEGTADLRNDVDELIYLDCYKNEPEGVLEVTTRPDKVRADLKPKTFTIDLKNGRKVTELGYTKNIVAKEKRHVLELFKDAIRSGLQSQKELLEYAEPKTSEGKQKLRTWLIEFTHWDQPEIVATPAGRGKDLRYALAGV